MKAVRAGICVLIAFAVLAFGGVEPWGKAILQIGASALLLVWGKEAVRRRQAEIRWHWLYLPLAGLGTVAFAQRIFGLSVYSYATKIELLNWGASVLLFFLAVQSFRTLVQVRAFIWFLILLGFFVSLLGIVQHFTSSEKLYWLIPSGQSGDPFGPFVNHDHFAGFVELTAPLGLALILFGAWQRDKLILLILFGTLPIGALVLCSSRGGILGFATEVVLLFFVSKAHRVERKRLLGAAALALIAGLFVVWLGVNEAVQRFEELTPARLSRDRRVSMDKDTWKIYTHNPWVGTGLGTLMVVYPRFESDYDGLRVIHAHNDYLELLADTGTFGGLCGLAFVLILFRQGFGKLREAESRSLRAFRAGSLAACTGLLVHSFVDFNLHIPSNAIIFLLLALVTTAAIPEPSRQSILDRTV